MLDIILGECYPSGIVMLGKCRWDAERSKCAARPQTQRLIYALVPPFTMIHNFYNFTQILHHGVWSQLAFNAPRSECSAPWTGIWSAAACFRCKYWSRGTSINLKLGMCQPALGRMPACVVEVWKCSRVFWFGARTCCMGGFNALRWCHPRGAQNMKAGYKTRMNEFHLEMKSGSRAQF